MTKKTDVHYRSMTGEGNFNWRLVYPFEYFKAEEKIVYKKEANALFGSSEVEVKTPPWLTMQVWDADIIGSDNYLGTVTLDLNRIPKPAKNVKNCRMKILKKDGTVPCINLFKNKTCKGWWPLIRKTEDGDELMGKVEAELILVDAEEAEANPVGLGRNEPQPMLPPNRPDTGFMWFLGPLKTLKYILWRNFKAALVKLIIISLLACFIGLFFYAFPDAVVNSIFT